MQSYRLSPESEPPKRKLRHARNVNQAQHEPRTAWDAQRTTDDMIRAMQRIDFEPDRAAEEMARIRTAKARMVQANLVRLTHVSGLTSPFAKKQ